MSASLTSLPPTNTTKRHRVAPWWLGYLFISTHRRLLQNPERMLSDFVSPGDRILDVGPGMGYFTLPLARMVGDEGRVTAVDCQQRMLDNLDRRAKRQGLSPRIETRCCDLDSLDVNHLAGTLDLALAFNVVHEAADHGRMIGEMARALRPGGMLVLSEPKGHVSRELFDREIEACRDAGLTPIATPNWRRQMTVILTRSY